MNTVYRFSGRTYYVFRYAKGAFSGSTSLSVQDVMRVIKGADFPTSRQRANYRYQQIINSQGHKQ